MAARKKKKKKYRMFWFFAKMQLVLLKTLLALLKTPLLLLKTLPRNNSCFAKKADLRIGFFVVQNQMTI